MLMISKLLGRIKNDIFWKFENFLDVDDLICKHFKKWSSFDHQNIGGLTIALKSINSKNPIIVETGTSAWGTDSSRMFDSYVRTFGGRFYSVDISHKPARRLKLAKSKRTNFYVMDSVKFLEQFEIISKIKKIDLIYLDSWDVDWSNPFPSAQHGYKEILAARKHISAGTILIIDDTPKDISWIPLEFHVNSNEFFSTYGSIPGKGSFYQKALAGLSYKVLYHEYNLVILFD